ncbi:hypothetical protein B0J17DRAFT_680959 [Rhizoctonia solani]|nr:hypothetical protein B0J17DRAFT_680959 [Rhizoctonia solani]
MSSTLSNISSINNHHLVKQERKNNKLAVHRLSAEVLSRIMLIGVESDRRVRCWGSRKVGSQQIASHVCRYWRIVATNTPMLWTFVHIASIVPSYRDVLYLIRAGPTAPLDIAIDLTSNNMKLILLSGMMRAITSQGAQTTRWRSLLVCIDKKSSAILSGLLEWLGQNPVPSLQRLYFDFGCNKDSSGSHWPSAATTSPNDIISANARAYLMSLSSNLLCYELALPSAYTFGLTRDMFTNLRELTIISHKIMPNELSDLLLSNPQLEYLCLSTADDRIPRRPFHSLTQPDTSTIRRTVAPSLCSLFIGSDNDVNWALRVLMTIEATGLQDFALKCDTCNSEDLRRVVTYITTGVRPSYSMGTNACPIFPSLQSLDLSRFTCDRDQFINLVSSYPELPHIALKGKQIQWLNEASSIFHQLESLGVLGIPAYADSVKKFISRQEAAGHPIKEAPRLMLNSPFAPPGYMYSKYEYDVIGDLQNLRGRSTNIWRVAAQF